MCMEYRTSDVKIVNQYMYTVSTHPPPLPPSLPHPLQTLQCTAPDIPAGTTALVVVSGSVT